MFNLAYKNCTNQKVREVPTRLAFEILLSFCFEYLLALDSMHATGNTRVELLPTACHWWSEPLSLTHYLTFGVLPLCWVPEYGAKI